MKQKTRFYKVLSEILGAMALFLGLYFCFLKFGNQLIFEYKYIFNGKRVLATVNNKKEVSGQFEYQFSFSNRNSHRQHSFSRILKRDYKIGDTVLVRYLGK